MKLLVPLVCDSLQKELCEELAPDETLLDEHAPLVTSVRVDGDEGDLECTSVSEIFEVLPREPLESLLAEYFVLIHRVSSQISNVCQETSRLLAEEFSTPLEAVDEVDTSTDVFQLPELERLYDTLVQKDEETRMLLRELGDIPDTIH